MATQYRQAFNAIKYTNLYNGGLERLTVKETKAIRRALLIADAVESGAMIKRLPQQERNNRFYWEAVGCNACIESLRNIGAEE